MKKLFLLIAVCLIQLSAFGAVKTTVSAPSGVTVKVYSGFANEETLLEPVSTSTVSGITSCVYNLDNGNYHFISTGEGYFNLRKNFVINGKAKKIDANPGAMTKKGYEQPGMVNAYTDECTAKALSVAPMLRRHPKLLSTPSFTLGKQGENFTSQEEMMDFINKLDDTKDNMYVYTCGHTYLGKDMPFVVFTTDKLAGLSLEEAATALRANGKPTIYIHANIHGGETSSGEAALALIAELDHNYGKKVLPKVNVILVPRVNGDGIEAWTRGTAQLPDLNRDNLLVRSPEIKATHYVYNLFMPEIVLDLHEYGTNRNFRETVGFLDDAGITISGNQNNTPAFNNMMYDMMRGAEKFAADQGYRLWEYTQGGYSDQSPLHASHYYALRSSANFLVEAPNTNCEKKSTFGRRVSTHFLVAEYMIQYAIDNKDHLQSVIAADRAAIAADGEKFTTKNPIVLKHGQNEESYSYPRKQFNFVTGEVLQDTTFSLRYYEVPEITRPRPTAYVIPKNLPEIARILEVAYYNGITYYELQPNEALPLRGYEGDGKEATLLPEKTYVFADGAYVFPMNQESGIVLAMLMEPDFRMTDRNPISYHQAELLPIDKIFRSEKDLAASKLLFSNVEVVK